MVWVLRRGEIGESVGGGAADELPRRGAPGLRVQAAVNAGLIEVVTGFRTVGLQRCRRGIELLGSDGRNIVDLDEVVVATGYRPDLSFLSQVRLDLDPRLLALRALAPSIDPNEHSCESVAPHGFDVLRHEGGLYVAGMKSYGLATSFLAMVGYEQVRSICCRAGR